MKKEKTIPKKKHFKKMYRVFTHAARNVMGLAPDVTWPRPPVNYVCE